MTRRQMLQNKQTLFKVFKSRGCGLRCKSSWIIFLFFVIFHKLKSGKLLFMRKTRTILVKFEYHSFQLGTQSTFMFQLGSTSSHFPFCFHFHSGQQNFSFLFCAAEKVQLLIDSFYHLVDKFSNMKLYSLEATTIFGIHKINVAAANKTTLIVVACCSPIFCLFW